MYAYRIRKTIDIHDGHTLHILMIGVGARPCGTERQAGRQAGRRRSTDSSSTHAAIPGGDK